MRGFSNRLRFKKISEVLGLRYLLVLISCCLAYGFTFNAGFWKHSYTVSYNANSATGGTPPPNETFSHATTVTVAGNSGSLVRTGYTFGGWNTLANGSGTNYTAGSGTFTMDGANVTLYAKWTINTYTVTYDANGGTSGSVPGSGSYNYASTFTVASNSGSLVRTGYTFGGWNTLANGSGANYTAGSGTFTMGAADVTLYAKWNANSYTVTYNANGATSGSVPGSASYVYGSTVTVASNTGTLKRTDLVFGGWNTAADGSGTTYTEGTGTFSMGAANIILYAKWNSLCSLSSYAVPAPTVWPIGAQIANVRLAGQTRTFLKVTRGTVFNLTYDFNVHADGWCPGCIQQFYTGYSGQIQSACSSFSRGSTFKTISGKSVDLTAPATPGAYYLSTSGSLEFSCVGVTINPDPSAYFALICVQ